MGENNFLLVSFFHCAVRMDISSVVSDLVAEEVIFWFLVFHESGQISCKYQRRGFARSKCIYAKNDQDTDMKKQNTQKEIKRISKSANIKQKKRLINYSPMLNSLSSQVELVIHEAQLLNKYMKCLSFAPTNFFKSNGSLRSDILIVNSFALFKDAMIK